MRRDFNSDIIAKEIDSSHLNLRNAVDSFPRELADRESKLRIQLKKANIGPQKKLLRIYEFYESVSRAIAKSTPCKKGCSSCCHYPVSITEDEVSLIESSSANKRNKQLLPKAEFHGTPCPFLSENGECQIYEIRPFSCRRHYTFTTTSGPCHPEIANSFEVAQLRFSEAEGAFNDIRFGKELFDIRQVFG